ncbi:MAG: 23S rRNA (uracil(1939)-C(5))-methyltransferase RlmD, partial [Gammaproteobacteria bacterium]|nr:23S rRNA (uracil(1939)-C(5))-methyltransferase RlmD [Gammaproteobacteria bacterium]
MNKTNKLNNKCHVNSISHDGRGIAHINGKTTFIEGALPNEEVEFVYTKKRSQYDEAKATAILTAAPERVTPKCPHFGVCGGCSLQHMAPNYQIEIKQQILLEQLQHFGDLQPETVLPPLTGPAWNYRRKARLGVKYVVKKEKVLVGFREKNGRFLADLNGCEVLHESVGNRINELSTFIATLDNYKEIPQIEVAVADEITALVIRHMQEFSPCDLAKLKAFAKEQQFQLYLQPKGPDSVHLLYPEATSDHLKYTINNVNLLFHPLDFTQINSEINKKMVAKTIELLQPQSDDAILDLFCGLGNFTLPLARLCQEIIGVEGSEQMVERATNNAKYNNINNTSFYTANLDTEKLDAPWMQKQFNKILL